MYSIRPDSRVATRPDDAVADAAAVSIDPPRGTPSSASTPSAAASPDFRSCRLSRPSSRLFGGDSRDEAVEERKKAALRPADADAAMDAASNVAS